MRVTATNIHGEAQRREKLLKLPKQNGCATSRRPDDLSRSTRAPPTRTSVPAGVRHGQGRAPSRRSSCASTARDILCFKLAQARGGRRRVPRRRQERAGRQVPQGRAARTRWTRSRRRARRTPPAAPALPVDKKFGEAIDLYATLFPADPTLVGVIFKNGQMFYDYGEYDEAIKRFGVIVTKYPKDPNAGPAGDRILSALNKAQDYENIENWARKLQDRADASRQGAAGAPARLIVESIQKSGDKYADAGKYEQAATFYLRVPKETTRRARSRAQAMMNAGVDVREGASCPRRPPTSTSTSPRSTATRRPSVAEKAAFAAGAGLREGHLLRSRREGVRARRRQVRQGRRRRRTRCSTPAVLRQALGQNDKAIAHYKDYAKKFATRKDAPDVAFNIGVVYEDAGEEGPAYQAFADYARDLSLDRQARRSRRTRARA